MNIEQKIKELTGKETLPTRSVHTSEWLSWYRNNVPDFHEYKSYNGENTIPLHRKSLGMAKYACETWASLLLNEKCDIVVPGENKKNLDKLLKELDFWKIANGGIEKSFALGIGALLLGVKDLKVGKRSGRLNKEKSKLSLQFVNALQIIPISVVGEKIIECGFISGNIYGGQTYILHLLKDGEYTIYSYEYNDKDEIVNSQEFQTKSQTAWFFILKPALESNYIYSNGVSTELGISVYANAIDILKSTDDAYDCLDAEFILKRPRKYVSSKQLNMSRFNRKGTRVPAFDPYDPLYYKMPGDVEDDKPYIEGKDDEIRADAIINGINKNLNLFGMKVGLGENFFKFDGSNVMTATQVISENSTMFRNVKKHEQYLENVLLNFTKAITDASNKFTNISFSEFSLEDITITFDDSIFEDTSAEMERDRADVNSGLMSPIEYRMKWYGEDDKTAHKNYSMYFTDKLIEKYSSAFLEGLMTAEMFVEKVYPYAKNKEALIKHLEENKKTADSFDVNNLFTSEGDEEITDNNEEERNEEK